MDLTFKLYPILNSQGEFTLELSTVIENTRISASVPTGTSVGTKEAVSFSVVQSIDAIKRYNLLNILKNKLTELPTPREFDEILINLDPSPNKQGIGGNVTLLFSVFYAKVYSFMMRIPLYKLLTEVYYPPLFNTRLGETVLLFNLVNGGRHGNSRLFFQEFKIGFLGKKTLMEQIQLAVLLNKRFKRLLKENNKSYGIGLEGGYIFEATDEEVLELLQRGAEGLGLQPLSDYAIFLDVAASEHVHTEDPQNYTYYIPAKEKIVDVNGLIDWYTELAKKFPIVGFEDPFAENDNLGWEKFKTAPRPRQYIITGDDLTATNPTIIKESAQAKYINNVIIKPNQIGTLKETFQAIHIASNEHITITISHRSRETNDTFLSHIVAACNPTYAKLGNIVRGERTEKYNELIRIERELI